MSPGNGNHGVLTSFVRRQRWRGKILQPLLLQAPPPLQLILLGRLGHCLQLVLPQQLPATKNGQTTVETCAFTLGTSTKKSQVSLFLMNPLLSRELLSTTPATTAADRISAVCREAFGKSLASRWMRFTTGTDQKRQ